MPSISVVVPALDEQGNVRRVAQEIRDALARTDITLEIVFVDDGSRDGTWSEIRDLSRQEAGIRGIRLSRHFGKESAIVAGLDRVDSDAVVIMDADLQHPARIIPSMIERWQQGAQVVHGAKRGTGGSWLRRLGGSLFYGLTWRLSGIAAHGSSDFKLLDREVVRLYQDEIRERNRFFRITTEWLGFERAYVEYDVVRIEGRRSRWSLGSLLQLAIRGLTTFSAAPLHVPTVLGLGLLVLSTVLALACGWLALAGTPPAGDAVVITTVLFTGSLILISLGILGEYVATIHDEVKHRPIYAVQDETTAATDAADDGI
jgi:polyisoprenyl-phosphate glycosyltransferase